MANWLFKEEPTHYSYSDLEREGRTTWDGVSNNLALKNLRQVKRGDRILFYHTGKEKAIVGEMRAAEDARVPASQEPSVVVVDVEPVRRWRRPVSLAEIKKDPLLAGWELVRLPRLSVVPVSEEQWQRLHQMESMSPGSGVGQRRP
ncbi:MAG: EVE domain-containing protein [Gemmataceae bacterium]|nr:EVE domain-containing protein [Gemmataceae bacterium]MDW8265375.1 EVE domain-containing protein [Gemmataceae bacterium]